MNGHFLQPRWKRLGTSRCQAGLGRRLPQLEAAGNQSVFYFHSIKSKVRTSRDDCENNGPRHEQPTRSVVRDADRKIVDATGAARAKPWRMKRMARTVIGVTVLLIGIALLVLPGPAVLVIPIGLAILAAEFAWAERLLQKLRGWLPWKKVSKPGTKKNTEDSS
ncbi:MAG: PGPGW domain-containing protein [Verrucomicrobia bacterium]|nr:PGPGW domain-containing protein [Verrucomicrobiota bacterium]